MKREFQGLRRGKLTVICQVEEHVDRAKEKWKVLCDCGTSKIIERNQFYGIRSCGCLSKHSYLLENWRTKRKLDSRKFSSAQRESHRIWVGMHSRCDKKNDHLYPGYGGRGIRVCEEWNSFITFWNDMGARPSREHSIEREDVNQGYSKKNCRWLLKKEQSRNTRKTIRVLYKGEVHSLVTLIAALDLKKEDFKYLFKPRRGIRVVEDVTIVVEALLLKKQKIL